MKTDFDRDSESLADFLIDERNSVGLLALVAVGSGLVGLLSHYLVLPVWMSVTATVAWVLASPLVLRTVRGKTQWRPLRELWGMPHRVFESMPRDRYQTVRLALAASAAVIVATSIWLTIGPNIGTPDRVITTGNNETTTAHLSDGSVLSLGARSTVTVNVTGQQRVTHLTAGEVVFDVAKDATRPFVVETFLAKVTAAGGKFRVAIDSSVEIEVYEGVVQVSAPGAKPGAPMRQLQKGDLPYRVMGAVAANGARGVGTGLVEG